MEETIPCTVEVIYAVADGLAEVKDVNTHKLLKQQLVYYIQEDYIHQVLGMEHIAISFSPDDNKAIIRVDNTKISSEERQQYLEDLKQVMVDVLRIC